MKWEADNMNVNQDIISIAEKIRETVPAEKIYLFGSYAYGKPSADSDYDFFIVLPDNSIRPIEAMQKIYRTLSKSRMHIPVDILASNVSKFDELKTLHTLENKIFSEGVLLYERI